MNKYYDTRDTRVLRTKKILHESFLELLYQKPFQEITVSELAKKADINRKTFYLHYSSTRDLLDEMQDEILDKMLAVMSQYDFLSKEFNPYPIFLEFNQILHEDAHLVKAILFSPSGGIASSKIKQSLINYSNNKYKDRIVFDTVRFDFYLDYTIAGLLALYVSWLSHTPPLVSIEELAQIACEISYHGFDEIISVLLDPSSK